MQIDNNIITEDMLSPDDYNMVTGLVTYMLGLIRVVIEINIESPNISKEKITIVDENGITMANEMIDDVYKTLPGIKNAKIGDNVTIYVTVENTNLNLDITYTKEIHDGLYN